MGIPLKFLSNMSKKSSKKSSSKKSTRSSSSSSSSRRSHRNFPGRYTYSVIGARDVPQGGYGGGYGFPQQQQQFGSYAPAVSGYGYPAQQQFAAPPFGGYGAYPQQQQFGTYQF